MKNSIRIRFTLGMIFLFIIILVLSVFSGFYMNRLSKKTSAILKENYLSVVYAREMSEGLMNINLEITTCFLTNKNPDSIKIANELSYIDKSLRAAKNNITEAGEGKLVSNIETGYNVFHDSVLGILSSAKSVAAMIYLQEKSGNLNQQLLLLSQMNGNALELKTDDAKISSKNALTQMTVLATFCFLIGFSFTYSFASYFNRRFYQLFNGIKEIVSSNFNQRLLLDGNDEFYEISLAFNEMAEKLNVNKEKMSVNLLNSNSNEMNSNVLDELRDILSRLRSLQAKATELISILEK